MRVENKGPGGHTRFREYTWEGGNQRSLHGGPSRSGQWINWKKQIERSWRDGLLCTTWDAPIPDREVNTERVGELRYPIWES